MDATNEDDIDLDAILRGAAAFDKKRKRDDPPLSKPNAQPPKVYPNMFFFPALPTA